MNPQVLAGILFGVLLVSTVLVATATGITWVSGVATVPSANAELSLKTTLWKLFSEVKVPGQAERTSSKSYDEGNANSDEYWCYRQRSGPTEGGVMQRIRATEAMFVIASIVGAVSCALAVALLLRKLSSILPVLGAVLTAFAMTLTGTILFATIFNACDLNMCDMFEAIMTNSLPPGSFSYSCNGVTGFALASTALAGYLLVAVPVLVLYRGVSASAPPPAPDREMSYEPMKQ